MVGIECTKPEGESMDKARGVCQSREELLWNYEDQTSSALSDLASLAAWNKPRFLSRNRKRHFKSMTAHRLRLD